MFCARMVQCLPLLTRLVLNNAYLKSEKKSVHEILLIIHHTEYHKNNTVIVLFPQYSPSFHSLLTESFLS